MFTRITLYNYQARLQLFEGPVKLLKIVHNKRKNVEILKRIIIDLNYTNNINNIKTIV
jgi:hypothetical protein